MGVEDHPSQDASERDGGLGSQMCCVYWCREAAVIVVRIDDGRHGCCRKHAAFIEMGKMDWFER